MLLPVKLVRLVSPQSGASNPDPSALRTHSLCYCILAGVEGIEHPLKVLETSVIPFHHTPIILFMVLTDGLEPSLSVPQTDVLPLSLSQDYEVTGRCWLFYKSQLRGLQFCLGSAAG